MFKPCLILLLLVVPLAPAQADACDDLLFALEGAITAPGTTPSVKGQLEALLKLGRDAKAAGNVSACERAMNGQSSPAPGSARPPGYKCQKTPDTV